MYASKGASGRNSSFWHRFKESWKLQEVSKCVKLILGRGGIRDFAQEGRAMRLKYEAPMFYVAYLHVAFLFAVALALSIRQPFLKDGYNN